MYHFAIKFSAVPLTAIPLLVLRMPADLAALSLTVQRKFFTLSLKFLLSL